jgi:transcriptional regulator with XRE-family HTH domain
VAYSRQSFKNGDKLNSLGPRLRQFRMEAGLSQEALAATLTRFGWETTKATISFYEKQKRSLTDVEVELVLRATKKKLKDF